jgi:hypothetical protein
VLKNSPATLSVVQPSLLGSETTVLKYSPATLSVVQPSILGSEITALKNSPATLSVVQHVQANVAIAVNVGMDWRGVQEYDLWRLGKRNKKEEVSSGHGRNSCTLLMEVSCGHGSEFRLWQVIMHFNKLMSAPFNP